MCCFAVSEIRRRYTKDEQEDAHLEAHLVQRRTQSRRSAKEDADLGGGMGRSDRAEDAVPIRTTVLASNVEDQSNRIFQQPRVTRQSSHRGVFLKKIRENSRASALADR